MSKEEIIAQKKLEWLTDIGMSFADILVDDEGVEYVLTEPILMDEGEEEYAQPKRLDVPDFSKQLEEKNDQI